MCRHGDANTWSVEMRCEGASASVNVTSVRDFIERYGLPTPTYVKVDVEGGEWAGSLLDGLASLRVPLLSFEYAVGWSPRLFGLQRPLTAAERGSVAHTLHRFEQKLDERGYDTFLVHADRLNRRRHGVTLVPISGGFWDGEMEICFNRSATYGAWGWAHACWNDLIAVHRCEECTRRVLFETMHFQHFQLA